MARLAGAENHFLPRSLGHSAKKPTKTHPQILEDNQRITTTMNKPTMKAPPIRLLLSTAALIYTPRSCLGDTAQRRHEEPAHSALSPIESRRRQLYNRHDHSRSGPDDIWNDFLANGREPRGNREPEYVDYMGKREC